MWIKWLYCDHGHGGYKELEIPDNLDGYDSIKDYLISNVREIPTWSERFLECRVKWRKIKKPSKEVVSNLITLHKNKILYSKSEIIRLKKML